MTNITLDRNERMSDIPRLAVRIDEDWAIFEEIPVGLDDTKVYAVALVNTIQLPEPKHGISFNLNVVAAARYSTWNNPELHWGWVHLEYSFKDMIGQAMVNHNATPDRWYYLVLSGGIGTYDAALINRMVGSALGDG